MRRLTFLLTLLVLSACADSITAPRVEVSAPLFDVIGATAPAGLVAHWPLDGDVQDSGPNALHGSNLAALPTVGRDGTEGSAMAVADGSHMAIPDNPLLDVSGSFTLAFWIRVPGAGAGRNYIVSKGRDVYDNFAFYREAGSDEVRFYLRSGQYDPKIAEVSASLTPEVWHHLAAVVNDGVAVTLFLDGELAAQRLLLGAFASNNDHPLVFGRHYVTPEGLPDNFPFPFTGDLDDVQFYGRALTVEEIAVAMEGISHPDDGGGEPGGDPGDVPGDDGGETPAPDDPVTKADCKGGGWTAYGFKNQGQCVRFVETGKDSR